MTYSEAIETQSLGLKVNSWLKLNDIPVAISVRRSDLLSVRQDHSESVRAFFARINGKAITCAYKKTVTFIEAKEMARDALVKQSTAAGITSHHNCSTLQLLHATVALSNVVST